MLPLPAHAGIGVPPPYVEQGRTDLFVDGFYTVDDTRAHRSRTRFTYDYGATDQLMLRARPAFEDDRNDRFRFRSMELSLRYEFAEPDVLPIDLGLYAAYLYREDEPRDDEISARLLFSKNVGRWQHRGNIMLTYERGEAFDGSRMELRLRSQYRYSERFLLGAEYFGEFGDLGAIEGVSHTSQRAGPSFRYHFQDAPWHVDIVPLIGLNRNSDDVTLKWRVGVVF